MTAINTNSLSSLIRGFDNADDSKEIRAKSDNNIYVKNKKTIIFRRPTARIEHQLKARDLVLTALIKSGVKKSDAERIINSNTVDNKKITVGDVKKSSERVNYTSKMLN